MAPFFIAMDTKETVELLKKMQAVLLRIQDLEERLEATPTSISEMEADTGRKEQLVSGAQESLKQETVRHASLENELKSLQDQVSDKNVQSLNVKTNEQLWALQKEIKFLNEKASDTEMKIIQAMEDIEAKTAELAEAKKEFQEHKKENDAAIARLKQQVPTLEKELEEARKEHSEIATQIPNRYAALLERIQKAKGGAAMTEVSDSTCTSCNYRIRPQAYMEVKMGTAIHQCPSCSRILYYNAPEPVDQ